VSYRRHTSRSAAIAPKETTTVNPARRLPALLLALAGLALLIAPAASAAEFGFEEAGVSIRGTDGNFSRQAGAHPDLITHFKFNRDATTGALSANGKDVSVDLPHGLVGNPNAVAKCPVALLVPPSSPTVPKCPPATQIGIAKVEEIPGVFNALPVYNMEHPADVPGLFGFNVLTVPVFIQPQVNPGDYRISALSARTSQARTIYGADVTIWGVPADADHHRAGFIEDPFGVGILTPVPDPEQRHPFLSNPTSCPGSAASFDFHANSWQNPGAFASKTISADDEGTPLQFEGCEKLGFSPTLSAQPGSKRAASPTGIDVNLAVPQNQNPDGFSSAHVKKTVVTFPKGLTVNAASAKGQSSCSPAQIGIGSNEAPTCPDASKLGTVEVESALLEAPAKGNVILASPYENPFDSLLAIYIVVKGPGFYLKLPGKVQADPVTGQLKTIVDNAPQLPFENLRLSLNSGPHAALQAPEACGTYQTQVEITSWASATPVSFDTPMTFDEGCGTGGFNPGLKASTASPIGASFSPFNLQVTRQDGEQNLARIEATLPEGLLAKLAGVPLCPEAAAASGNCPAASQVGTTSVGAGAGSDPVYVPEAGKAPTAVYLAGPYKGAPYSLVVKVPAQAGPFDLGTVTVRNALSVDPVSTQVTAKSDPLPQILQGIPVAYRDVRVEVNRPGFTLNPTSCDPMTVDSTLTSAQGKIASPSARFQVTNCAGLSFAPKLGISVKGSPRRGSFQKLKAVLTQPKGQANIGKVSVALPHSQFLAQEHIKTVCTRVQFAAGAGHGAQCPAGSIYGKARAISPLLDQPLSGPVYLRSSSNPLPDLVVALHGAIDVELAGRIDSVNGGIRTTFNAVPDAPVSKFVLEMKGGKKSLLVNSRNLCASVNRATVKMDGQNGKANDFSPVVASSCGGKAEKKRGRRG
jgi:hypothetical protein